MAEPKQTELLIKLIAKRPSKLQWIAVLLGVVALVVFASPAYAAEFKGDEGTVRIGANEIIEGDLFVGAQALEIDGTVNGDVFTGAANTTIRGTINGSVNAAGGSVLIEGPVTNGVRAAAGEFVISAPVGRDLIVAGESLKITGSGKVGGDAIIAANDVSVEGDVGGRVLGFAERLRLSAGVGQYVDVGIGELEVDSSARIGGDLKYQSANESRVPTGTVAGRVIYVADVAGDPVVSVGETILNSVRWGIAWILAQALLGLLLFALARGWMERAASQIVNRPWISLATGTISGVVTVPAVLIVSLILLVIFGLAFGAGILAVIPLPIFGIGLFALAMYVSPVIAALVVGRIALERLSMETTGLAGFAALLVGLVLFAVLGAVPYVGWAISALAAAFGLGGAILATRGKAPGDEGAPG